MSENAFDRMRSAIAEARATMRAADTCASVFADLLLGRLDCVPTSTLRKLKRELRDFDAQQKVWKS
jgi:hypothetical protein